MAEAMHARHTVRKYTGRSLPYDVVAKLDARIRRINQSHGLALRLVTENGEAFGPLVKLVLAKGVRNYIVLAGKDAPDTEEKLGYWGADVMLFAQTLGLNSWWVGGTFSRRGVQKNAAPGTGKILGLLALGYGQTQGVPHKSKSPAEISRYQGTMPPWFSNGIAALLLAPTALNRQAFQVEGTGNQVKLTCDNGIFSNVDLGIGKYHFELGAGKENFHWI